MAPLVCSVLSLPRLHYTVAVILDMLHPDRATVEQCNYVSNEPSLDTGHVIIVICVSGAKPRKNRVISRIRMLYTHINHGKGYN